MTLGPEDIEHEYKFLVADESVLTEKMEGTSIAQAYFETAPGFDLRVRIEEGVPTYRLTFKGPRKGAKRIEWEWSLSEDQAHVMMEACPHHPIEKTRYGIAEEDGSLWDIDRFHGVNEGLVLAELEIPTDQDPQFNVPAWCGREVTDDDRYYNAYLARRPYTTWSEDEKR